MTAEQWAAVAGRAQGERTALLDVVKSSIEILRDYQDIPFALTVLESIVMAVEENSQAHNDNTEPKARA